MALGKAAPHRENAELHRREIAKVANSATELAQSSSALWDELPATTALGGAYVTLATVELVAYVPLCVVPSYTLRWTFTGAFAITQDVRALIYKNGVSQADGFNVRQYDVAVTEGFDTFSQVGYVDNVGPGVYTYELKARIGGTPTAGVSAVKDGTNLLVRTSPIYRRKGQ